MAKRKPKPTPKPTNGNIEQLALEAKLKRQADCSEAVNKVLASHNCELQVFVRVGEVAKPLNEVLGLQTVISIVAKAVQPCQV